MPDTTFPPAEAGLTPLEDDATDRLLFGRIIALAAALPSPLTVVLGLSAQAVQAMIVKHVPAALALLHDPARLGDGPGAQEIEEADLRAFILEHRSHAGPEPEWLAAILARRSLASNHLWQDMGFADRGELNLMFARHFPALKARNAQDMKWKKFFYRSLCEREGLLLCKSPNCEVCEDFHDCFGAEPGDPLSTLAHLSRPAE